MGWVEALHGKLVGLDTAPIVYFMEENPVYLHLVDPFFEAVVRGDIHVVTSALTLTEILVYPKRRNDLALMDRYTDLLLSTAGLTTLPVSIDMLLRQLLCARLTVSRRPMPFNLPPQNPLVPASSLPTTMTSAR